MLKAAKTEAGRTCMRFGADKRSRSGPRNARIGRGLLAATTLFFFSSANSQETAKEGSACNTLDGWRYVTLGQDSTSAGDVTLQLRRNSPELTEALSLHLIDRWQDEWIVNSGEKGWVATVSVDGIDLFSLLRLKGWRDYMRGSAVFSFDGRENGRLTGMDIIGLSVKNGLAIPYDWFDSTVAKPPDEIVISDNCSNLIDAFHSSSFLLDSVSQKGSHVFNQVDDALAAVTRLNAGGTCAWVLLGCAAE
ncbi:MAG: hypothetical protein I8H94_04255 [Rhodobacteraceae bacterium]|nr:hypothetical protein [Paracoccaceae bacterium]